MQSHHKEIVGKVSVSDTTQEPIFQKCSPELLDENEKPLTNLVSYLPKQDLLKAELKRSLREPFHSFRT